MKTVYIRPKNANDALKKARDDRQTTYIYGVTGYGKTSLVRDFLSHRKYQYVTPQTLDRLEIPEWDPSNKNHIVVIDDLYTVKNDQKEDLKEIIRTLSERNDIWLILMSRSQVPEWLKPIHFHDGFKLISESYLSLSFDEARQFFEKSGVSILEETLRLAYSLSEGYPFVLRILAMELDEIADTENRLKLENQAITNSNQHLYDFLNREIYDQWPIEIQTFLTELSILDSFSLEMAQAMTQKSNAAQLIQQARELGNFLMMETKGVRTMYTLRGQSLYSLRDRLIHRYTKDELDAFYKRAGHVYESQGNFYQALKMFEKANDEMSMSRILIMNSQTYVGNGEYYELRHYYKELSKDTVRTSPELMVAMSMIESILMNDEESEYWYDELKAYGEQKSGQQKQEVKQLILYLDICLPQRGTGRIASQLKNGFKLIGSQSTLPDVSLTNNQPTILHGGKDFCPWVRHDRQLALLIGKPTEKILGKFGKGIVNLSLAESFYEKGDDPYEVFRYLDQGQFQAESGGKMELVFVAVGIRCQLMMLMGKHDQALEILKSFRKKAEAEAPRLLEGIDTLYVRLLLRLGMSPSVEEWMNKAPDENFEFSTLERYRYVTKARVYLTQGDVDLAVSLLHRLKEFAKLRVRYHLLIEVNLLLAIAMYRGQHDSWDEYLCEALESAESFHFVRMIEVEGGAIYPLLKKTSYAWKDQNYRNQVLNHTEHVAQLYPSYLAKKRESGILSELNIKVLRLQAEGMSIKDVAQALNLSVAGVKYHNSEIYKKLGVKGRAAAISEARNRRLI